MLSLGTVNPASFLKLVYTINMRPKLILIALVSLVSLIVWLPFFLQIKSLPGWGLDFSGGVKTVAANFDGPNYLIIAKTWYNQQLIRTQFSNPLPLEYYPAHLPFYPLAVSLLDYFLSGPIAMLLATFIGTALFFLMLYHYLEELKVKNPLWLCLVFLILPARFLVVRHVGSPEPWFMFFILASLLSFKKQNYWMAGVFGALAQLTKSPGILLFAAYGLHWLLELINAKKINLKPLPVLLIPLSALGLFYYYYRQTGDFLAYFHSGDNFHLFLPPFSIFSPKGQFWTGDFWLEEILLWWLIYGYASLKLWSKGHRIESLFSGIFFISTLFVAHRDLSRYILPIAPFALLAYQNFISKREFKIIFLVLILPSLLYAWNFILNNTSPVADWTPYL